MFGRTTRKKKNSSFMIIYSVQEFIIYLRFIILVHTSVDVSFDPRPVVVTHLSVCEREMCFCFFLNQFSYCF